VGVKSQKYSLGVNMLLIFLSILTTSNEKTQDYKVVDLIEIYNFSYKKYFHLISQKNMF